MSEYLTVDLGEDAKRERKNFKNMPTLFKWIDERIQQQQPSLFSLDGTGYMDQMKS